MLDRDREILRQVSERSPAEWREAILILLDGIHSELVKIREATETEAIEDSEDPFQTLNGPSQ